MWVLWLLRSEFSVLLQIPANLTVTVCEKQKISFLVFLLNFLNQRFLIS